MRRSYRWLAMPPALLTVFLALALMVGAGGVPEAKVAPSLSIETLSQEASKLAKAALSWYQSTQPTDRVTWGGLAASAILGLGVVLDRMLRLRKRRILPNEFDTRFLERLQDGRLDRGKALDYCELNNSPASRVALAAVKRWGRPTPDLDRAVALALRIETDRLRRNVGTLRRVAALSPLLGLLGSLFALGRTLNHLAPGTATWGPALAQALWPLTAGVALATIALVLYDGLAGRVEKLAGALEQVGSATIDAIVMAVPVENRITIPPPTHTHAPSPASHGGMARTPHQVRLEIPKPGARVRIDDEDEFV